MRNKKFVKICFCSLLLIIYGSVYSLTFDNAKNQTNNYLNNYFDSIYRPYVIDNAPFKYENSIISKDTSFLHGGMLNKEEFILSRKDNSTYLTSGFSYWTMTKNNSNHYVIDVSDNSQIVSKSDLDSNYNRVTEYLKSITKVTGSGTYINPWVINLDEFKIQFNGNGINVTPSEKTLTYGQKYGELPVLVRSGYNFLGWYDSLTNGNKIESDTLCYRQSDQELFAHWEPIIYKIKYNLNNSTASGNPATYTVESPNITLNNPSREGYEFLGWTGTDLSGNTKNVVINNGSIGDREYNAVLIDRTPPTCTYSKTNTGGYDGVTIIISCTDDGSGLKSSNVYSHSGVKSSTSYNIYDNDNNYTTVNVSVSNYDCDPYQSQYWDKCVVPKTCSNTPHNWCCGDYCGCACCNPTYYDCSYTTDCLKPTTAYHTCYN